MSATESPVDVDVLREEIRKTYTDVSTEQEQEFIFPPAARGPKSSATPNPSSRAYRTRPSRVLPGSRTTGRWAVLSLARWCSTSAAAPALTC